MIEKYKNYSLSNDDLECIKEALEAILPEFPSNVTEINMTNTHLSLKYYENEE